MNRMRSSREEKPATHRFGETVKAFRSRKGLSLRELALRTGLSVGILSQIERNVTSPSLKTLTKLRIGLGVPLSALFEDEREWPERRRLSERSTQGLATRTRLG